MQILSPLTKALNFIDRWLIHESCMDSPILLRKGRVLVFLHLFLFLISFSFHISNTLFYPDAENPSLIPAMLIIVGLSVLFKWKGNFTLSGNLLALLFFLVQMQAVPTSCGIYSDNLIWMMAAPLLALLFANVRSGIAWLVVLLGYTGYMYYEEVNAAVSYREQTKELDAAYYLITWSGLFIIVVGIVLIFAEGQNLIVKALNEKKAELEKKNEEISRQARWLREAQAKLKASNKELEQFAYAASHDLKEPLRMIGTYVQLIERKLNDRLDESSRQYMHFVTDGVTRMDRLLTDLLEYSRVGRKTDMAKDTNLNETLFVVVNNLMSRMKENDAEICANELPVIKVPSMLMMQLFQNLISNSIKFRKQDEKPVVEIQYENRQGYHRFYFKDNGIGIPADQKERVFNIFERLHGRQEYEGTGIGLATCKKIIENLGGEIWVESEVGVGTTFAFSLPSDN
ncbi:MAG: hypothetical protein CMN32_02915 [Saprospirales bacterium]|nr:hypothetical protein [Saprospirales bacterium]